MVVVFRIRNKGNRLLGVVRWTLSLAGIKRADLRFRCYVQTSTKWLLNVIAIHFRSVIMSESFLISLTEVALVGLFIRLFNNFHVFFEFPLLISTLCEKYLFLLAFISYWPNFILDTQYIFFSSELTKKTKHPVHIYGDESMLVANSLPQTSISTPTAVILPTII
jgi:hypothetical protein